MKTQQKGTKINQDRQIFVFRKSDRDFIFFVAFYFKNCYINTCPIERKAHGKKLQKAVDELLR